jgi:hypothetical protein
MQTQRLLASFLAAVLAIGVTAGPAFAKGSANAQSPKAVELREALRDLWVDHIFWVRSVVVTTRHADGEAAKVAEANVVKNAKAIAGSIVPYYGKDAGDKLFGLLAGHYGAVKDYMTAAYADDAGAKDAAVKKLTDNAGEIAAFLSSANPNWPKDTLLSLLGAHGGHHVAQIDAVAAKDYSSEADTWGMMKKHMYVIADALAAGIVKQFPGKF